MNGSEKLVHRLLLFLGLDIANETAKAGSPNDCFGASYAITHRNLSPSNGFTWESFLQAVQQRKCELRPSYICTPLAGPMQHDVARALTLPDGTSTHGLVMRRKIDGKWCHRRATAEEEADYVSCEAW